MILDVANPKVLAYIHHISDGFDPEGDVWKL